MVEVKSEISRNMEPGNDLAEREYFLELRWNVNLKLYTS